MGRIDEIRKSTQEVMKRPPTSGLPHAEQMRQLLANNIEASALVHDEIVRFETAAEKYSISSERFAKTGRLIALASLGVAIVAIIISLIKK